MLDRLEFGNIALGYYKKLEKTKKKSLALIKKFFFFGDLIAISCLFMIYKNIPKKIKDYWIIKYSFNKKFLYIIKVYDAFIKSLFFT